MNKINKRDKDKSIGIFYKLIGDGKRQNISIPIILILMSFLAAAIIILIIGKNPLQAFYNLIQGAGLLPKPTYAGGKSMLTDFLALLDYMTPLLFASLAVAVALKGGLFNIGVSGQMLLSGFVATVLVGYSGLDAFIAKPLVLIIGIIIGGLFGALIGLLKFKFNINEVVSTIMFNYIIQYVVSFFINYKYIDPVSRQSKYISQASRLTLENVQAMGMKMDIALGFFIAIALALFLKFVFDKTKMGFEIKAVGLNPSGAKYAGINVGKTMILAMALSGAFAGLAGVTYYLGYNSSIQPRVLPALGFNSIAVALLGNTNPYGIIASSFIISIIDKGSTYMSSISGVRQEIASVITGLILLFSACRAYILNKARDKHLNLADVEEEKEDN